MKHFTSKLLISLCILFCSVAIKADEKTKVACVGNSITENSALPQAQKYPSLLQSYLGDDYVVRNYGIGGRTLLKKGNLPYWNEDKYTEVKNWNPDIVVIKLGTNDSKASNWQYKSEFVSDYVEFINSFKNLSSNPTVYICKPLPAYPNTMDINGTVIHDEILPMIEQIAQQTGIEIIDLYTPLEGKRSYLYDDVHPNAQGTTIMAHVVCKAIEPTHIIPDNLYSQVNAFDWTDKVISTTSSKSYAEDNLSKLFDNNLSTNFTGGTFEANTWIQIEMSEMFKITGYALSSGETPASAPKKWKIQGSETGNAWTDIETRSDEQFLRKEETNVYQTEIPNDRENIAAYKYYRIIFLENNGGSDLELSEWQIFGFPAQLVTNITGNGGSVKGQHAGYTGEGVENLINNLISKKYCVVGQKTGWIEYESASKVKLQRYSLTSCVTNFERNPKAWTLEAYDNDLRDWVTLDSQSDQDFLVRFNTMEYKVQNEKSYSRFRLNITENNGDSNFQFCKWQLFGEETSAPIVKKKIACIGNSITFNGLLPYDEKYVTILGKLMGEEYDVRNYGVGGTTMLKAGENPYWNHSEYTDALTFEPDIVIIKLGTNDTRESAEKRQKYVDNYIEFIESFQALGSNPEIYVCYPLPAWQNNYNIRPEVISGEIIPNIDIVASRTGAKIIDLYTPMTGKSFCLYDNVHPDVRGTTIMAYTIFKKLCSDCEPVIPLTPASLIKDFDYSDLSKSTASSISGANINNLFDNEINTEIKETFTQDMWFSVELPQPIRIMGYALTSGKTDASNSPRKWVLQGSTNGTVWNDVDAQENQNFSLPLETNLYQLSTKANTPALVETLPAYNHYRIVIKEVNGGSDLELAELQLFGHPETFVTSITGNGGSISGQHTGYTGEGVENLINNNITKKYCVVGQNTGWIQYDSPEPFILDSYSITSCINLFERNLKSWELLGSNNGNDWDVIDTRNEQDFLLRFNTINYSVNTTNEYSKYRLNITGIKGESTFQFSKWQLFERENTSINNDNLNHAVKITTTNGGIQFSSDNAFSFEIFNLTGTKIQRARLEAGTHNIPMQLSGVYVIKTQIQDKTELSKILMK